jgi:hypothetical protein
VIALLAGVAVPLDARAQPPTPPAGESHPYDSLLARYRSGAVEPAVEALTRLLEAEGGQRQATRWIAQARDANRRADLEAALLLYTDAIMLAWPDDHPFPAGLVTRYTAPFVSLRLSLKRMDPRAAFLRNWYLLWESFRQVHVNQAIPLELDFLADALDAFPNDAQVLLAAGSRHQLTWWMSLENAQRDPDSEPAAIRKFLMEARGYFRRSLKADAAESEARLRLTNVLLELNDLDDVPGLITDYNWTPEGPAFEYLARLFEGRLHERRGNRPAAAAAYDRAIGLVALPQTAQVARAHLAYLEGERPQASAILAPALANRSDRTDPWWAYIRGQAWRFDSYSKIARGMIK